MFADQLVASCLVPCVGETLIATDGLLPGDA